MNTKSDATESEITLNVRWNWWANDIYMIRGVCGSGSRATVLLSEGRWFYSPGLHVKVSLGKMLIPKTAPCMAATAMNVCINYWWSLWTKASAKCCKWVCKYSTCIFLSTIIWHACPSSPRCVRHESVWLLQWKTFRVFQFVRLHVWAPYVSL